MCVIIDRKPKVVIPADMIELACDINKHGFGIAFADRGKLEIVKVCKQKNDPAEVLKWLDDLKNHHVYLHLRHATVGAITEVNQHPFVCLEGRRKAPLVAMMHNGTIHSYSPPFEDKETSDTWLFNERLVRPLLARTRKALGEKRLLHDQFVQWLIAKETGLTSKIVLFDAFGNALHINRKDWKEFDGWIASNDYSFDTKHHRSSSKPTPSWVNPNLGHNRERHDPWDTDGDSLSDLPWMKEPSSKQTSIVIQMADWEKEFVTKNGGDHSNLSRSANPTGPKLLPSPSPQQTAFVDPKRQKWEIAKFANLLETAVKHQNDKSIYIMSNDNVRNVITRSEKVQRDPFVTQAGISSLDMVGMFTEDDLMQVAADWPQATAALVVDLLYERINMKNAMKHYADKAEKMETENRSKDLRLATQADFLGALLKTFEEKTGEKYQHG